MYFFIIHATLTASAPAPRCYLLRLQVCKNPHMFSSPNLVVRLNGKYYTWMTACPIVMTMITFQKQLTEVSVVA